MAAGMPNAMRNGRATATRPGTVLQGASVAVAAGANPTKAEFDALVVSLRNAGVIVT